MTTADLNRRIESLIRLGLIAEVDHNTHKLRVRTGGLLTGWLPWPAEIGRNFRRWRPLRVGTQVILACPSGDPAQATVVGVLYTQSIDTPSHSPDLDLIEFNDGTRLQYDSAAHQLTVDCVGDITATTPTQITAKAGKQITLDTPLTIVTGQMVVQGLLTYQSGMVGQGSGNGATATINGPVKINSGSLTLTGGDITADGVSSKHHKHPGDSGGTTEEPIK